MKQSYSEIWDPLAITEEQAWLHVTGYTNEAQVRIATDITIRELQGTVGVSPTDEVLEIGCGVGRVGRELASRVRRWTGGDVSRNMLAHAGRRLAGLENVELVMLNGRNLQPLPTESFDLVYCTVVFMHLEEWDRFRYVQEAWRVLRPGGRFFCDAVNLDSDEGWKVFEAGMAYAPDQRPGHLSRCSTAPEIACYLRRAGFQDVRIKTPAFWVIGHGIK